MLKYATNVLLSAEIAGPSAIRKAASAHLQVPEQHIFRVAHRADFSKIPRREGYLYIRNRAISSRVNENFDEFSPQEIIGNHDDLGYNTFIGKPVFVNHANSNHRRARGVNIAAALHEDYNSDGSPDTWVELLKEIDARQFPKLAQAILSGRINETSMGVDCGHSTCSIDGNVAQNESQFCVHIPALKGLTLYKHTASGTKVPQLIFERCGSLVFFEDSLLVEPPADPTAVFLGVEDRMQKRVSKMHTALNEIIVPPNVDTLRDDTCAVCGSENSLVNDKCSVCGFPATPGFLQDPNTDLAKQVDVRQDQQNGLSSNLTPEEALADQDGSQPFGNDPNAAGGDLGASDGLICPACGNEFASDDAGDNKSPDDPNLESDPHISPAENAEPEEDDLEQEQAADESDPASTPGSQQLADVPKKDQAQGMQDVETQDVQNDADADQKGQQESTYQVGDLCPACGKGLLEPNEQNPPADVPDGVDPVNDSATDSVRVEDGSMPKKSSFSPYYYSSQPNEGSHGWQKSSMPKEFSTHLYDNVELSKEFSMDKNQNPAGQQRSALFEALNVQASRIEDTYSQVRKIANDREQLAQIMRNQAAIINTLAVRNATLERQVGHLAVISDQKEPIMALGQQGYRRVAQILHQAGGAGSGRLPGQGVAIDDLHDAFGESGIGKGEYSISHEKGEQHGQGNGWVHVQTNPGASHRVKRVLKGSGIDYQNVGSHHVKFPARQRIQRAAGGPGSGRPTGRGVSAEDIHGAMGEAGVGQDEYSLTHKKEEQHGQGNGWYHVETSPGASHRVKRVLKSNGLNYENVGSHHMRFPARQRSLLAMVHRANPANPGQPVFEPNPEGPVATNETAMQSDGRDDVTLLGATPVTDVSADVNTAVDEPYGELANEPVGLNRVDVTAPVDGTQEMRPPEETIVPVDVRVGDPDDPQPAFPWSMNPIGTPPQPGPIGPSVGNPPQQVSGRTGSKQSGPEKWAQDGLHNKTAQKRVLASMRLAQLQVQANIAQGDPIQLGTQIADSNMSEDAIAAQTHTLAQVVKTPAQRPPEARRLVPQQKTASAGERTLPSLQNHEAPRSVSNGSISDDEFGFL